MRLRFACLALVAASCGTPVPECTTTLQCGASQACLSGSCQVVSCLSNADCDLTFRCSTETYECEPGCSTSDDCFVGDRCDVTTGQCVARQCTNTQIDCDLAERCDLDSGRCVRDPEPHCRRCTRAEQCGPEGECSQLERGGPAYCFLPCSPESFDPCPAGLQCSAQITPDGQPAGFRCVGLCGGL